MQWQNNGGKMSNYPCGAENDPNAPWNQKEPKFVECDDCGGSGFEEDWHNCQTCGGVGETEEEND